MSVIGNAVQLIHLSNSKSIVLYEDGKFNKLIDPQQKTSGAFEALKGTGTQSGDTIVFGSGEYYYNEGDNDYGGIVTYSAMSFEGYDFIRIILKDLKSWQDSSFHATAYILSTKPSSVTASGISSYQSMKYMNYYGNSGDHIARGRYEVLLPVSSFQNGSYYLAMTCASGSTVSIVGTISLEKITLEKGTPAYSLPKYIWNGYDKNSDGSQPWNGGDCGGFISLQGTTSSQSDGLTWNSSSYDADGNQPYMVSYRENNNDYGGIRTNRPTSFEGYSYLHIDIANIASWQDLNNYYASVFLSTTAYTKTASNGYISNYQYQYFIDKKEDSSSIHIKYETYENAYKITIPVSELNGAYYTYIMVASGSNSGIPNGLLKVSRIWLEP